MDVGSIKPYYEQDGITIYHGDCREILPYVTADVVITDPPYGVGFEYKSYDDSVDAWRLLILDMIPRLIDQCSFVVSPCCQIRLLGWWYENIPPDWIIAWYKGSPGHRAQVGFNDWEPLLTWGKPQKQMHDHFQTRAGFEHSEHPCPKPLDWALWLVGKSTINDSVVLDPFMGSGTTLVAAKQLGRKAIGIEIEEKYCEIAAKRLAQRELFGVGV